MCGITGFVTTRAASEGELRTQAAKMSSALQHRGPDGEGLWVDVPSGVALAHRRLAIVDLSPTGAQPMESQCGNYVIVYNGEVYNAPELAKDLESTGLSLRGTSDTEVILEGFARWGITDTIKKLIGMFAIAVWNKSEKTLTLIRDRLGIKPVYWCKSGETFLFGSELKSLTKHKDCPRAMDRRVISGYLQKGYINAPCSILENVYKLEPGKILTLKRNSDPQISTYWSLHTIASSNQACIDTSNDSTLIGKLEELLSDAVTSRMISDVPIGAFLSGGIDSSAVVALMQKNSHRPVKTYSIGFKEDKYNEAKYANDIASHLNTDHTQIYVTANDALDIIPQLHRIYDEPFADSSQIPTFLLSALTKKHVTVALSGDGGDELFAGYSRYHKANKFRGVLRQPHFLRSIEANIVESLPENFVNSMTRAAPGKYKKFFCKSYLKRIPPLLRNGQSHLYSQLIHHLEDPAECLLHTHTTDDRTWQTASQIDFNDQYGIMQYIDSVDYLPDDILTKLDRASMAASLEARVPILDHRVVEFSWRLPEKAKVRDGESKWILRKLLENHVPRQLFDRPKMGFSIPIDTWIRGPLNEWASHLLSPESIKKTETFNPVVIQNRWKEHQSEKTNWQFHLWDVLMFQDWALNNPISPFHD